MVSRKATNSWLMNGVVMFSDESTFCLWQNDRLVMVRGFRGERRSLEFTVRGHAGITPGVKRYGILLALGTDPLWSLWEAD
jgi:hypothetical protein